LRVEDAAARLWYMNEAADQNWNTRALDRQIGTLYYERLLASKDRQPVREEAAQHTSALSASPRDFIRDPVMLEFLGLPNTGKLLESALEDALIGNLQSFLLELGKGARNLSREPKGTPPMSAATVPKLYLVRTGRTGRQRQTDGHVHLECGGKRYPARRRFLSTTDQKRYRTTLVTALQNVQEPACGTLLPLKRVWVLVNEEPA